MRLFPPLSVCAANWRTYISENPVSVVREKCKRAVRISGSPPCGNTSSEA